MIDVDYNEYKKTLARNMELIVENNRLKQVEIEHRKRNGELKEENNRLNNIVKALKKYVIDVRISEYGDTLEEANEYLEKLKRS